MLLIYCAALLCMLSNTQESHPVSNWQDGISSAEEGSGIFWEGGEEAWRRGGLAPLNPSQRGVRRDSTDNPALHGYAVAVVETGLQ